MINLWYVVTDIIGVNISLSLVVAVHIIKNDQPVLVLRIAQPLHEITDNSFKVTKSR